MKYPNRLTVNYIIQNFQQIGIAVKTQQPPYGVIKHNAAVE
jgi:ABC-type transport system substrate-binding protein